MQSLVRLHDRCYPKHWCEICLLILEADAAHKDAYRFERKIKSGGGVVDGEEAKRAKHEGHEGRTKE